MIAGSEVGGILKKYGISRSVAHPENFRLLERDIPDLCADRIDYTLRDHFSLNKDRENVESKLQGLRIYKGEFMFSHTYAAESFARDYLEFDEQVWADPKEIAIYELLAQAIRHALDKKILTVDDLFTDDETVRTILQTRGDPYIRKKLAYLIPGFRIEKATKRHYHLHITTKRRYVDPKVVIQGTVKRLSELSPRFRRSLKKHLEYGKDGWYVNVCAK